MDSGKMFLHAHVGDEIRDAVVEGNHVLVDRDAWEYAYKFFQDNPQFLPENNLIEVKLSYKSTPAPSNLGAAGSDKTATSSTKEKVHYALITYSIDGRPVTTAIRLVNGNVPIHYVMNKSLETKKSVSLIFEREIDFKLYNEINEFEEQHGL